MTTKLDFSTTVEERSITSPDGTTIFAQAVGDSRLPTLVFIHGLAMSSLVWAKIFQDVKLLKSFYLVAYDLRGHGRSGKPDAIEGYTSELYAQDFDAVMKALGVTSPILVGWSLGATIATDVAAYLGSDTLAGIVYTAGLPWLDAEQIFATEWLKSLAPSFAPDANSDAVISSRIEFVTKLFNHPEKVPTDVLWSWIGGSMLQPPSKFMFLLSKTQDTTRLFEAGANGMPLLIINGESDRFLDGEKVLQAVKGHFKDLTVHTIANGSHAFFYEDQEEYVAELAKFAKRVFANRSN
ncbi:hypothetical protein NMY22_g13053 [Coprinellus aureogranulatus]|nr:hypothetical protein NMY22_g13053 [Coprinellus aureogranulatus]